MEFNEKTVGNRTYKWAFATYPEVVMYDQAPAGKPCQHLIFGDYINLLPDKNQQEIIENGDWVYIRSRNEQGWIRKNQLQKDRILEINFVDIGQGDGCHIVTPDDRQIVIDAGLEDNMYRFISWRYNLRKPTHHLYDVTAVITHPDADHYKGFQKLFDDPQIHFSRVYHNGIVERANDPASALGSFTKIGGQKYLNDLMTDHDALCCLINDENRRNSTSPAGKKSPKMYPTLLYNALENTSNQHVTFQMLSQKTEYVPGYGSDQPVSIKVLGPVVTDGCNGEPCLKYFGDPGKTKNGHSVVLLLQIGRLKVLLGGDLNIDAEDFLLNHYTGIPAETLRKQTESESDPEKIQAYRKEQERMVELARKTFEVPIAKACHHGSHHFTTEFLRSVHAVATIISSGDNESYSHPRPDAIGAFGKYGRGERPLIFSTELARSHRESIKKPHEFKKSLNYYTKALQQETDPGKKANLEKKLNQLIDTIERTVAVYGMINVRTDGKKVIICQKLEKARSKGQKWDIHELVFNPVLNDFEYKIKLNH